MLDIDAFVSAWQDWCSAFESYRLTPEEFVALPDNRVLVLAEGRAKSNTGGVEMTFFAAAICTVVDGLIRRVDLFLRRERALEAAGISER